MQDREVISITITRRALLLLLAGAAVAFILVMAMSVWIPRIQYRQKLMVAKQNMHSIQLSLERFAVDQSDSSYPVNIQELLASGYLPELPLNPFTAEPMRPLNYNPDAYNGHGYLVLPGAKHGDFVYYPRYEDDPQRPSGYTLFLY